MEILTSVELESFLEEVEIVNEITTETGKMIFGKSSKYGSTLVHFNIGYDAGYQIYASGI